MVSVAMLMTACKKDEANNNGNNNNNNTENPGGGDGGGNYNNQDYPNTANVIRKAVTDIDGNIYDAVQIGNQVWMAENLRTTRYADGTTIPFGNTDSYTEPYRYAPGLNQSNEENMGNVARYGYLYNWPAVMHGASSSEDNPSGVQGICPDGWHVPSDAEWTELTNYMKTQPNYMASGNADRLAKALAATWGWNSSSETDTPGNNPTTNNATGFSALPAGGYKSNYGNQGYYYFGTQANFWSSTKLGNECADIRQMYYINDYVHEDYNGQMFGFSVRCVHN